MTAYYNEIDPYAAQWLRNLISVGLIADGDVDERSIAEVKPDDLRGYTQCHFFAGIGVWGYALRQAGWDDDREVWTGSCPCQPFSAAGKGEGAADARHLWPDWFRLIRECRPVRVFGEQVGAAIRHGWLDLVSADLEGAGYALGAAVVGAHSVGAPHIRQRLFFVADAQLGAAERHGLELASAASGVESEAQERQRIRHDVGDGVNSGVALGHPHDTGSQGRRLLGADSRRLGAGERAAREAGVAGGVAESDGDQHGRTKRGGDTEASGIPGVDRPSELGPGQLGRAGAAVRSVNGFWSACDWLPCIDGKARPVEPGTFPLAHGATARVGRLRAYGNAIVAPVAAEFIRAYLGC